MDRQYTALVVESVKQINNKHLPQLHWLRVQQRNILFLDVDLQSYIQICYRRTLFEAGGLDPLKLASNLLRT